MIKDGFFPTIIYAEDFKLDTNQLAENITKWSKEDPGVTKTNVNGWHSKTDMHNRPEYKPLVDELFRMAHEVFKEEYLDERAALGNMWAKYKIHQVDIIKLMFILMLYLVEYIIVKTPT